MPTLEWIGKDKVVNHHLEVPYRVLEEQYTYNADHSENMIIRGDNLEALKALLPRYEGRVKCVYIDPPYNTGEESWIYNDNVADPQMQKWLGEIVGKEDEDLSRHDKWLCMMYPRLKLLQRLLHESGSIFISIDDNELSNLRLMCDEIFGARNFIAIFIWEKRLNRENRKAVSSRHDYVLCYAKNRTSERRVLKQLPMSGEALDRYSNPDNDPRGPWKSDPATAQAGHATQEQFYVLQLPNGKSHTLPAGRCWLYTKENMIKAIAEGRIWLGADGNNVPRKKTYLFEKDRGLTPETIWFADDVSTNEQAKNELKRIFPETIPFTTPKPHELVERMIQICSEDDDIILDSFAGSGTTAHAVLNMNKADGGHRKFILVEMMDYAESITAERVKRVIDGYGEGKNAVEGTGGDFTFYDLGPVLLLPNGNLNEDVGAAKIREYVYFMETKSSIEPDKADEPYYMGVHLDSAYYFYYERDSLTTLNRDFLGGVKTKAGRYTIYADQCTLSQAELERWHITFKKIPRDISKL
ncbi:putative methyltransferase [uncultured Flavonifractor sp.]|nr:putative methyltransferase [uncultured Flavonifractor sp.]